MSASAEAAISAALRVSGLRFRNGVTEDGEATFELGFTAPEADKTGTSWEMVIIPQLIPAFDVKCTTTFTDAQWRAVPATELARLCVEVDAKHALGDHGHLEFTRKTNTVAASIKNEQIRDGETPAALAERLRMIAASYGRVHVAVASVVAAREEVTRAVARIESDTVVDSDRTRVINSTMEKVLRDAGMRTMDIEPKSIKLDIGLENGRARLSWQFGMSATGGNMRGLLRFILPAADRPGPDRRAELAAFVALANYGIIVGHFDMDPSDCDTAFNVNLRAESTVSIPSLTKMFDSAFRLAAQTFDRYLPGIKAIKSGTSAVAAIELVEGERPALPEAVLRPSGNNDGVEEIFSQATLSDSAVGMSNVRNPNANANAPGGALDPPARLRQAIIAGLNEVGIMRYDERGNRFVFGLTFEGGINVGNDVQYSQSGGDSTGLRVLHRVFDTKGADAPLFGVLAELVTRCNFGMNYGFFDLDPSDNTVSFNVNIRFERSATLQRMTEDLAQAFKCCFDTYKRYMPALRHILYPSVPRPDARTAIAMVEGEDAFDLDGALMEAENNQQPDQL